MIRSLVTRGVFALAFTAAIQAQVPVPQATYTTGQLHVPLRTFTSMEIGITPTYAQMHKGHLVIAGGRSGAADPTGYARLTTWRLSQAATPGLVNPSVVGTHLNDAIFKTHNMGFSGDLCQVRAGKFAIYNISNAAAPAPLVQGSGGLSSSHSTCWAGKYLYTGGEGYGTASGKIDIFNVANPAAPVFIRTVDIPTITGFRCASVYVLGNVLVVSASLTNGIATFDLSDPTNPLLISVFRGDAGANTYTSYLSGHRLYGGGQGGGLYIYDIQNPENIQLVQRVTALGGTPRYPVVQDEFVHLGNVGNGRYQKVRVDTNPAVIVADVALPGRIEAGSPTPKPEVAIPIGNLVFVGCVNGSNTGTSVNNSAGWILPHDTAPDTRAPEVNAVRPLDGETSVAPTSMIGVSFTDQLETSSIGTGSVIIRPFGGSALAGTYSNMGGIVNFTPAAPLLSNTTYEIVIPVGGVKDTQANPVTTERVFRFSTGASVDTTGAGLALHYPLDELSGSVADDAAGTNNGTLTGFAAAPAPWTAGLVGRSAVTLDGVDDFIISPSVDVGSQFSFSTWVRVSSGNTGLQTLVGNTAGGFSTAGFKLFVYGSAHATTPGRVQLETGNGTAGNAAMTNVGIMPFDQWVHLGLTVNRASGVAQIYVNGVQRATDSSITTDFTTTGPLTLGRMGTGPYFFGGSLDDFRLYSRLLNSGDLDQLRNLCENPVAHWRFNSSTTNSAPNGVAVTLSAVGATYTMVDSAEGTASLVLDGTSGYATAPSSDLGNTFTLATWVKVASGTNTLETIASNSNASLNTAGWRLHATGSLHATPGRLILETGNGAAGIQVQTPNNVLTYNTWTQVTLMIDRVRGLSRIYVNGTDQTPAGTARTDFTTTGILQIGRTANNANLFNGQLDDLRIHPRWLTESEIRVLAVGKLLAHWRFDGSGEDESGFARVATPQAGAAYSPEHARGSESLSLDGLANGLDDHATAASLDLGNQFSLSLWAKVTTPLAGSRTLLANASGGSMGNGFRFFINSWTSGDGRLIFETGNGTVGDAASTATNVFQFNQWNHLALVVNRATGTASIYYNRRLVSTDSSIRTDFANNLALYIGRLVSSGNFHGQIDDMRLYNKLLTAGDIGVLGEGSTNTLPVITTLTSSASAAVSGSAVTLTASASDPNVGTELFYKFDFGDGTSTSWTNNPSVGHTYSAPGRYVVTLSVSDGTTPVTTTRTQIIYNALTANPPSISAEMIYDTSRNKVWVVVPDGDDHDNNVSTPPQGTVVRFDATTFAVNNRISLGANSEPVALALRPGNAEVWVANKQNNSISILDANTGAVLATLNTGRGSLPAGVAFAPDGTAAFVACEGLEAVLKYNPTTRLQTGAVDTGAAPRGIAVTADSARLLVTRFRSPDNRGEVWEYSPSTIVLTGNAAPVRTFTINRDTTTVDAPNAARGVANYLSQVVITPDGLKAWVNAKKDNISRGTSTARDGQPLNHENTVRSLIAQFNLTTNAELTANRIDLDNLGLTVASCFSPRGDLMFAAAIGNEQIAVIDANSRNTLPAISTATGGQLFGFAPSGLCVSPDGTKLYVHNFLERKVRIFNISDLIAGTGSVTTSLGTINLTTTEPLSAVVWQGKKLFYNSEDPRLASEGYISCASCHLGGDQDGRVWDLTQFGEGLRNTIDLRGHSGMSHGALHWSANFNEVQDFENQIRDLSHGSGLISGTPYVPLGTANAGRSTELDALAAYVTSLNTFPVSPYRNQDGTFTAGATAGAAHFASKGCATCHAGLPMTDSNATTFLLHNIGTQTSASGQRLGGTLNGIDTPTLRAAWSTPPYLHRGQAATLDVIFNATHAPGTTHHARFRELNATEQGQLLDYLEELE